MLNAVAVNVVAQAERSGPLGPEFGKASPVGLLVIVLLFVAVLCIGWAVTRRIRRLNRRREFAEANGLDVFDVAAVDAAMAEQGLAEGGKKRFF